MRFEAGKKDICVVGGMSVFRGTTGRCALAQPSKRSRTCNKNNICESKQEARRSTNGQTKIKGYNKDGPQREYSGRIGARIQREIVEVSIGHKKDRTEAQAQIGTQIRCWRGIFWCGTFGRLESQGKERRAEHRAHTTSRSSNPLQLAG